MTVPYVVEVKTSALKTLAGLPRADGVRIKARIDALACQPRPPGVVKLSATEDLYRIRSGHYRIVYRICDRVLLVTVIRVGHRREVYR